jgi:hypothetical protein
MPKNQGSRIKAVLEIQRVLKNSDHIQDASISELSFKPHFMIDMDKRLVLVEIAYVTGNENVDWKTLRLIEHVFEAKLFLGNETSFSLILLDSELWKPYCLELLKNFFDKTIFRSSIENLSDVFARPKANNFELWNLEREFQRSRIRRLRESNLAQFEYRPASGYELEEILNDRLKESNLFPTRDYAVRNLKNYYLRRDLDLKFYFDFFVNERIVEIKSFKKMNILLLQDLLIKSRLIRYRKIDDRIESTRPLYKMILLINGDIVGPQYDRMRYLRMLTGAGWDVYPASILNSMERLQQVFCHD